MPIDNATQQFVNHIAELGMKPFHESTVEEVRKGDKNVGPESEDSRILYESSTTIPVSGGETIEVAIYKPSDNPDAVILFSHGGGFVVGDIYSYKNLTKKIANYANATVVVYNYRRAPEYPFPTAVNDSQAVLEWVAENKAELVGEDAPLIVMGDSAGGNLAAVLTHRAKAGKAPKIDFQVLVYPVVGYEINNEAHLDPENQVFLGKKNSMWFLNQYVSDPESKKNDVDFAPLHAKDFTDLPPAVILTAEYDILKQEGAEYAAKLIQAGVDVNYRQFKGQIHAFFGMVDILPGSHDAIVFTTAAIKAFIKEKS